MFWGKTGDSWVGELRGVALGFTGYVPVGVQNMLPLPQPQPTSRAPVCGLSGWANGLELEVAMDQVNPSRTNQDEGATETRHS